MNKIKKIPLTKLSLIVALSAMVALIALVMQPVNAQSACEGSEYTQGASYNGGEIVYMNGNNYSAKWWTQQTPPGSEWNDMGACSTGSTTDPGTTDPGTTDPGTTDPGTSGPVEQCVGVPFDQTISNYDQDDIVYMVMEDGTGMNYQAKFWTAAEPASSSEEWIEMGACEIPPPPPPLEGPIKIYYFVEWGVYARDFHVGDLEPLVADDHINVIQYSFIDVDPAGNCVFHDSWAADERPGTVGAYNQKGNLRQMAQLRDDYSDKLKITLSLGGWTLSGNFSDVANDDAKRANMIESCVGMMQTYRFDGIDVDWEYPGGGGVETNSVNEENDARAFTELMRDFRAALDVAEQEDGGATYYLTAAFGAGQDKMNHIEMGSASQYMDYLSVMTYDLNGAWQEMPAHNAPMYQTPEDPRIGTDANSQDYNVDFALQAYLHGATNLAGEIIQGGTPPEKLVMGLAFYGRSWANVPPDELIPGLPGLFGTSNNGDVSFTGECGCEPDYREMSSPMSGTANAGAGGSWEESVFDYDDIRDVLLNGGGYTRYWDEAAQVPYAYNPDNDGGTLISYDDAESIQIKAEYVVENCLGGIMVWETSTHSADRELYDAVQAGLGDYDPADCDTLIEEITNPELAVDPINTDGSGEIPLAVNVSSDGVATGSLTPLVAVIVILMGASVLRIATKRA